MDQKYKNYVHPTFSLNGEKLDFFALKAKIIPLKNSNEEHFAQLANFIEQWFSDQDEVTLTTSGTTGKPKPIQVKKQAMVASALATASYFKIPANTKALHCLPVQYIAGKLMFVRAILLGWDLTYIKPTSNPMDNLNSEFDFVAMVPLQVENSLNKMQLIKQIIIGGAKLNTTLKNKLLEFDTQVFETYGMTETVTHIAAKRISETVFSALPNVTFKTDDRDCLVIDAPRVCDANVITNDVVDLISETKFVWKGRADNVINSGGVKLFPEKIEEKLEKYISTRFFVAGIPDEKLGFKLILIIEGEKQHINFDTMSELQKFEVPKQIYFVSEFLETETSKIKRSEIVANLVSN